MHYLGSMVSCSLALYPKSFYLSGFSYFICKMTVSVLDQLLTVSHSDHEILIYVCSVLLFIKPFCAPTLSFLVGCLGICDQVSFLGSMVRREHKPSDLFFMGPDCLFLCFGHSLMAQGMQFSS